MRVVRSTEESETVVRIRTGAMVAVELNWITHEALNYGNSACDKSLREGGFIEEPSSSCASQQRAKAPASSSEQESAAKKMPREEDDQTSLSYHSHVTTTFVQRNKY